MLHQNFISEELIKKVRLKQDYSILEQHLVSTDLNELLSLKEDQKKSFWINLYNAFNLILLEKLNTNLNNRESRKHHFTIKAISIAGNKFSLDDIEHGILRRSKVKISAGYLNKLFPSSLERKLRVHHLDYRIHFALNCGGQSCPPIQNYESKKIDEQLEMAEAAFLESGIAIDGSDIYISELFKWYWKDFGGKRGIRKLIEKYHPEIPSNFKLRFQEYVW